MGNYPTEKDFNLYWKTIEKICEIISKKRKNKANNTAKDLEDSFESTIEILAETKIMNTVNLKNSKEILKTFIENKRLDIIVEKEKKDELKLYSALANKKIEELTDERFLKMLLNNQTRETFFQDFEELCKKTIYENLFQKIHSKEKFELKIKVNEIYLSIFPILIKKGITRLNVIKIKIEKEGNEKLSKEIDNLQLILKDLSKTYEKTEKKR